jgi:16S rRNA processing protein RimM
MKERPKFVSIGIIGKPHGVKGSIIVIPITDELEQFKTLRIISIQDQKGERQAFAIESVNIKSNSIILKLEGINDRNRALTLKGLYLDKDFDQSDELPIDEYYIFDLIGLKVIIGDTACLGEVIDVLTLPANDVYVVSDGAKEYLIPAIKDVIKKIDLEEEYILIEPIDGLL